MNRDLSFAIFLMLFLAVALGHPGSAGMDDAVVSMPNGDAWTNMWLSRAVADAVYGHAPLSANGALGFPRKVSLWPFADGVLWPTVLSPAILKVGSVFAHNLGGILALFLTGLCSYFFFRRICSDHAPSLIAAILFSTLVAGLPDIRIGNPDAAAFFAVPLAGYFALVLFDELDSWRVWPVAGLIVLSFLTNIYLGIAAIGLIALLSIRAASEISIRKAALLGGQSILGGLVLSMSYLYMITNARPGFFFSVFHSPECFMLSNMTVGLRAGFLSSLAVFAFLALAGLKGAPRGYRSWIVGGAFFIVLGMVAEFVFGKSHAIGGLRLASFLIKTSILCLAAASAHTLRRALEAAKSRRWPEPILGRAGIAAAVVAAALFMPTNPAPASLPAAYKQIAAPSRQMLGALLELPLDVSPERGQRRLFYQAFHRRPIISGAVLPGLKRTYNPDAFKDNKLFEALTASPETGPPPGIESADLGTYADALREAGVAYVMVHNVEPGALMINWLAWQAFGTPAYQDDSESLFAVGRKN